MPRLNFRFTFKGLTEWCAAARDYGIDITKMNKLKYRLLDRWLPEKPSAGSNGGDLDETVTNFDFLKNFNGEKANGDSGGGDDEVSKENDINFLRCVYLLQGSDCFDYTLQVGVQNTERCMNMTFSVYIY